MTDTEPPEECPHCGSKVEIRRHVGVYEWNWTCDECKRGDYRLKERIRP